MARPVQRKTVSPSTGTGFQQDPRLIAVQTPLGPDAMALRSFNGREELSRPFEYDLDMLAACDVEPKALIGKAISFSVKRQDGSRRPFHGYVRRLARGADATSYRATVVPWLWFLTQTSDCRIFQNMSVIQVIEQIFKSYGFHDYELSSVRSEYPTLDYCVQYRESAFDFVSRLMEEVGIFYLFRHEQEKHILILADQKNAYQEAEEEKIEYANGALPHDQVLTWERQYDYRPGKWTHTDYNFESPDVSLAVDQPSVIDPADTRFEMYDYPGRYKDKSAAASLARIRIEELESDYDTVEASSTYRTLHPGQVFELTCHGASPDADGSFVVRWIEHQASTDTYTSTGGGGESYGNRFCCIPEGTVFRPRNVTPRPTISGPQTAVVVGPVGEEVYTDEYGRIKVWFHWDRSDERSSCWIRVGQLLAGPNWGGLFIPRVGQEVIVVFLEGDPDRPIVVGTVFNARNMPPWPLPNDKMTSGFVSRSSKKGSKENASILAFDDTKGEELVTLHAERDAVHDVEHDDRIVVGNDQTVQVKVNRKTAIAEGDDTLTIDKGNRKTSIPDGMYTVEAGKAVEITVGKSSLKLTPDCIEITVGSSSVKLDAANLELASKHTTVQGELTAGVKSMVTKVESESKLALAGNVVNIN